MATESIDMFVYMYNLMGKEDATQKDVSEGYATWHKTYDKVSTLTTCRRNVAMNTVVAPRANMS